MSSSEAERKKRLWEVDPTIFQHNKQRGPFRHLLALMKSVGKSVALALVLAYPLALPLLGVIFGGLVFWGSLGASVLIMGVLLRRYGYGRNFEGQNRSLLKGLVGLVIGFTMAAGLYLGLFYYKVWIVPIMFGLLSLIFVYIRRK